MPRARRGPAQSQAQPAGTEQEPRPGRLRQRGPGHQLEVIIGERVADHRGMITGVDHGRQPGRIPVVGPGHAVHPQPGLPPDQHRQVGLADRGHRMLRHGGVPIQPIGPVAVGGEMLTEDGVAAEVGLGEDHRHRQRREQLPGDLEHPAEAAHLRRGVDGRTGLVLHDLRRQVTQPGQRRGHLRDQVVRRQRPGDSGEADHLPVGPQLVGPGGDVVRTGQQHPVQTGPAELQQRVHRSGEVVAVEPDQRHQRRPNVSRATARSASVRAR